MEPLAGLSLPAVGLWIMASLMSYAADRGMPVEPRFDSGAPSNSFRVDGAACRIRTGDPLITNEMLYQLS